MSRHAADLLVPRILVVDDESQIHASIRLRLGKDYQLVCCRDPREALAKVESEQFDLCLADIHMPHMNGLAFIAAAQKIDSALGYVVLSAFDTDENLRRTIPLQVYEFMPKPLPDRDGFEHRVPEWIERTRQRRRELGLAQQAEVIARDLECARLEREVELVASESARDALLQAAGLLTTIHAHLLSATSTLKPRAKNDPTLGHLLRNLEEAQKTAEAAVTVTARFFDSAYGHRDSSPALLDQGVQHAITIATRMHGAEERNIAVDFASMSDCLPIHGLSGIDFLLMLVPAIGAAIVTASANSTVRIRAEPLARIDAAVKDPRFKHHVWINRRHALTSRPGVLLTITAGAPAFTIMQVEAWLNGAESTLANVTARGLVQGLQRSKGLLGAAIAPPAEQLQLTLALPT